MADEQNGRIYDSIIWRGDRMIEISYTEDYNRGPGCCLVTTLVIPHSKLPDQYRELIDAITTFVDDGEIAVRNPPDVIPGG
jgi:hypothetical protein